MVVGRADFLPCPSKKTGALWVPVFFFCHPIRYRVIPSCFQGATIPCCTGCSWECADLSALSIGGTCPAESDPITWRPCSKRGKQVAKKKRGNPAAAGPHSRPERNSPVGVSGLPAARGGNASVSDDGASRSPGPEAGWHRAWSCGADHALHAGGCRPMISSRY